MKRVKILSSQICRLYSSKSDNKIPMTRKSNIIDVNVVDVTEKPKPNIEPDRVAPVTRKEYRFWKEDRPPLRKTIYPADPINPADETSLRHRLGLAHKRVQKKGFVTQFDDWFSEAFQEHGATFEGFSSVVSRYSSKTIRKWGFMEFCYVAIEYMHAFDVEKDIRAYNLLLNQFPRGPLRAVNFWSSILRLAPHEQTLAMDILEEMSQHFVIPNKETISILESVFTVETYVFQKLFSLMYWEGKLRNMNPYPLPQVLPTDPFQLSSLALRRISDFDQHIEQVESASSYIVSSQNDDQIHSLSQHPTHLPIIVEGPTRLWLRDKQLMYMTLRSEAIKSVRNTDEIEWLPDDDEYRTYATSIHFLPSERSAVEWVEHLIRDNPILNETSVIFKVGVSASDVVIARSEIEPFLEVLGRTEFQQKKKDKYDEDIY